MNTNYEFLIQDYPSILNYPILVAILPALLVGLIYILGKIRSSNNWQYHLDNKYIPFIHGIVVINNFVFIPLAIIALIYHIIKNPIQIISISFLSIASLVIVVNLIQTFSKQLIGWVSHIKTQNTETKLITRLDIIFEFIRDWKSHLKLFLIKSVFPIALYLSIFWVLKVTENRLIFILVFFLVIISLVFFADIDTITEQKKRYKIILKDNKKLNDVKIVEFLNDGRLIKLQEGNQSVKVIKTEDITEIILWEEDKC